MSEAVLKSFVFNSVFINEIGTFSCNQNGKWRPAAGLPVLFVTQHQATKAYWGVEL
jgi:hypothetical protein